MNGPPEGAQGNPRPPSRRQREVRGRRGVGAARLRVVRLRRDPHADLRIDRALRAVGRRDDRHRPQGDVHVPGPQGPLADAAAGEHGRRRAGARREGHPGAPAAAPPLVRGPAVPLRAAAGRAATASSGRSASSWSARRRPAGDAEVLGMLFAFLRALGFTDAVATLNCIPTGDGARRPSRRRSRSTCGRTRERLGAEDRKRLEENPLRLFDSKDPEARRILEGAPATLDFLDDGVPRAPRGAQAAARRSAACRSPRAPAIVRGLDYYTLTVFEVRVRAARRAERAARRRPLRRPRRRARRAADARGGLRDRRGPAGRGDDGRRPRAEDPLLRDPGRAATSSSTPSAWRTRSGACCPTRSSRAICSGRGIVKGLARAGQISRGSARVPVPRRAGPRGAPGVPGAGRRHRDDEGPVDRSPGDVSARASWPSAWRGRER